MKKILALLIVLFAGASLVFALDATQEATDIQEIVRIKAPSFKFKDLPDDFWASAAVYDLVKMGVTKGYPDGTFRGTKTITRYETAVFLSKMAKALGGTEIKEEIKQLKAEVAELKNGGGSGMELHGTVISDFKIGNLISTNSREGVADYRLILNTHKQLNENVEVNINLDTMDYGWYNSTNIAGGNLPTQLLDINSTVKLHLQPLGLEDPMYLQFVYGPGSQQHNADPIGAFPSEVGIVFTRPYSGLLASTRVWEMDMIGGYLARGKDNTGKITVGDLTGKIVANFDKLPLLNFLRVEANADYVSSGLLSSTNRNLRGTISLAAPLGSKVEASGTFGMSGRDRDKWLAAGSLKINDLWETGTIASIRATKVGASYLNTTTFQQAEFDMAGLDTFTRALENGTFNLGAEVNQIVSEDIKLVGKGELRLNNDYKYSSPKGRLTAQGGISYAIAPNTNLDAMYRIHQDRQAADTTDMAAIGLNYIF